jgi:hypothetical protein
VEDAPELYTFVIMSILESRRPRALNRYPKFDHLNVIGRYHFEVGQIRTDLP